MPRLSTKEAPRPLRRSRRAIGSMAEYSSDEEDRKRAPKRRSKPTITQKKKSTNKIDKSDEEVENESENEYIENDPEDSVSDSESLNNGSSSDPVASSGTRNVATRSRRAKASTVSTTTTAAGVTKKKPGPKKGVVKASIAPRKVQRVNTIIPITPLKERSIERSTPATSYELARERLHVSAVPDSLPCRENEFEEIMGYLESALEEGTGTCIYISGVPGTGKTATVLEVIRHLQHKSENNEIPPFDFAEINGMKLTDPNQAYNLLWDCLEKSANPGAEQKKRVTSAHALQLLEAKFNQQDSSQKTTVVLMDELDILVTKKQTVMYNFFEWPNRPFSKLIVVAVANTMDLPERMLSNKVSSRLGLTRINFQSYNHSQLFKIVESRLQGIDAFEKEAVEFAARKVSSVSGDARRALDICRRAVEIVESRIRKQTDSDKPASHVTIGIVNEAIREMFSSPSVAFIQSCSLHQKLFLVSVMRRARRTGLADVEFGDTALDHMETCKWYSIDRPTMSDLMRVCESLGQTRALVVEGGRLDLGMRISLNLAEEDIIMTCKSDKVIGRLLDTMN